MKDFDVQLISQEGECSAKVFALNLTVDLLYFDGHFQDKPILAAVAQLHLIDRLIKANFASNISFDGMKQLKFMSPIVPEQGTTLRIEAKKNNSYGFEFKTNETVNSKGLMCYTEQSDD